MTIASVLPVRKNESLDPISSSVMGDGDSKHSAGGASLCRQRERRIPSRCSSFPEPVVPSAATASSKIDSTFESVMRVGGAAKSQQL